MGAMAFLFVLLKAMLMDTEKLPAVDIQRYEGDWYLIGAKPSKFDRDWVDVREHYTWNAEKQRFDVVATYKTEIGGKEKTMKEKLIPVKNSDNARWTARIGWFIRADYVIYKIADDYSYVVIGHPERKFLYILARTPQMNEELYRQLVDFAVILGYYREEIRKDPQVVWR
jgi:apolipoprotein D and lipocalin family protein